MSNYQVHFDSISSTFDNKFPGVLERKQVPQDLYFDTLRIFTEKVKKIENFGFMKHIILTFSPFQIGLISFCALLMLRYFIGDLITDKLWFDYVFYSSIYIICIPAVIFSVWFTKLFSKRQLEKFELMDAVKGECYEDSKSKYKPYGVQIFLKFKKGPIMSKESRAFLEIVTISKNELNQVQIGPNDYLKVDTTFIYLLEDNGVTEEDYIETMKSLNEKSTKVQNSKYNMMFLLGFLFVCFLFTSIVYAFIVSFLFLFEGYENRLAYFGISVMSLFTLFFFMFAFFMIFFGIFLFARMHVKFKEYVSDVKDESDRFYSQLGVELSLNKQHPNSEFMVSWKSIPQSSENNKS
eukprot:gene4978-8572_t